jgi:integrase/recombinase XerD
MGLFLCPANIGIVKGVDVMAVRKILMNSGEKDLSLKQAFELFIKLKKLDNLSDETISYYHRCYKPLGEYHGEDNPCRDIEEDTFYSVLEHIKATRKVSPITTNTYIRGIRAILNFFIERKYIEPFKMRLIKCEKPIKETYTDYEIEKLIRKPDTNICSFAEFRNWAVVCHLLGTGNRLNTIINLKIEDVDINSMEIKLKTVKNKKPYIIPMSSALKKVYLEYLKHRDGEPNDYLFCTSHGTQMSRDSMVSAIQKFNKSRGVEKTSIHLFRHTFAKNWVMNGGDIFRLQKILGHSSLEMVKEYVSMFGVDIKENFDTFNALDKHSQNNDKVKISMNRKQR